MIVAIHQPNFLPWIGYFYKITNCDIFVLLDDVQYTKNSFINRNKIKYPQGALWLTVPVSFTFGEPIKQVAINNKNDWRKTHLKTFEMNYKKSVFFKPIFAGLERIYYLYNWERLCDFNIELITYITLYLGLNNRKIIKSSDLGVQGRGTELLINIIKKLKGDTYLSGFGGIKYQEENAFAQAEISLKYYDFNHPIYKQLWRDFIPHLSIIDLLFNVGPDSSEIIACSKAD